LLGHVGQPQATGLGLLAQVEDGVDVLLAGEHLLLVVEALHGRLDRPLDEVAHPGADLLVLGGEGEVDGHGWLLWATWPGGRRVRSGRRPRPPISCTRMILCGRRRSKPPAVGAGGHRPGPATREATARGTEPGGDPTPPGRRGRGALRRA